MYIESQIKKYESKGNKVYNLQEYQGITIFGKRTCICVEVNFVFVVDVVVVVVVVFVVVFVVVVVVVIVVVIEFNLNLVHMSFDGDSLEDRAAVRTSQKSEANLK